MNSNKYTTILKKIFSIFCIFLVLATNLNAEVLKSAVSQRETPEQFDSFLKKCSDIERIALAQSIGYLPAIPKEVFGKLEYKKGIVFRYSIKLERTGIDLN